MFRAIRIAVVATVAAVSAVVLWTLLARGDAAAPIVVAGAEATASTARTDAEPTAVPRRFAPEPAADPVARVPIESVRDGDANRSPRTRRACGLRGRVVYADDGSPLAGVLVSCAGVTALTDLAAPERDTTDDDGRFRFDSLPRGLVHVAALGTARRADLSPERTAEVELRIPRAPSIVGVVVDDDGRAVPDARVSCAADKDPLAALPAVRSDRDGRFALHGAHGTCWLRAAADGLRTSHAVLVHVDGGEPAAVRLVLAADPLRIAGRVVDAAGAAVAGAVVVAAPRGGIDWSVSPDGWKRRGDLAVSTRSDGSGRFVLDGIAPGDVRVHALGEDVGYAEQVLDGTARRDVELVLVLEAFAQLAGTVRNADGSPAAAASIGVRTATRDLATRWARVAPNGAFALEVAPGTFTAQAWIDDHAAFETELTLRPGEARRWDVVLPEPGGVRGVVVDARGTPLPDYMVVAWRSGEWLASAHSDAAGRFALAAVTPGAVTLRAGASPRGTREKPGTFHAATLDLTAPAQDVRLVVADEALPSASVRGRVLGPDGAPIPGAMLAMSVVASGSVRATSDGDGRLVADEVPPGDYHVSVRHPDHPMLFLGKRTIAPHERVELGDLRFAVSGRIDVRAFSPLGTSGDGPQLSLVDELGRVVGKLEREGDGWLSQPLAPGPLVLIVAGDRFARTRHPVTVVAGTTMRVDIELVPGLRTTIEARLPAGAVAPAWVWLSLAERDGTALGGDTLKAGDGDVWRATVCLRAGRYTAWVGSDESRYSGQVELDVTADGGVFAVALVARAR